MGAAMNPLGDFASSVGQLGNQMGSMLFTPFQVLTGSSTRTDKGTPHVIANSWTSPRHRLADRIFYNLSERDEQQISDLFRDTEPTQGSIVLVPASQEDPLIPYPDAVSLLEDHAHREKVGAVSVAGVGSSVYGAVGLARDVANATGLSIAAIVAGYGMDDLMYEAMGGWFCMREVNQWEFISEQMRAGLAATVGVMGALPEIEIWDSAGAGPDLATAKALLRDGRLPNLKLVVGHSKGNLVLSGALGELVCEKAHMHLSEIEIVLFSAISALPSDVGRRQTQIIGMLDGLGWTNSRIGIPFKPVPGAMHHLNRKLPLHLDAEAELAELWKTKAAPASASTASARSVAGR